MLKAIKANFWIQIHIQISQNVIDFSCPKIHENSIRDSSILLTERSTNKPTQKHNLLLEGKHIDDNNATITVQNK